MKNSEHKTLVGGALGNTQYVDSNNHIHIHFLGAKSTEVCCHGCGKSVIYLHEARNKGIREIVKSFIKDHEAHGISGANFEHWCPDIRSNTSVVDLTKKDSSFKDVRDQ